MMMLPNKKKAISILVEKIKKPQVEESQPEMETTEYDVQKDYKMAMEDAAKKMISAVEAKDEKMFLQHLMNLLDMKESCCEDD